MELDAVDERVVVNRAGVRGALTERLAIPLPGSTDVRAGHTGERHQLDPVNLDTCRSDEISTADLDLRSGPKPKRDRDVTAGDAVAQGGTELHSPNVT